MWSKSFELSGMSVGIYECTDNQNGVEYVPNRNRTETSEKTGLDEVRFNVEDVVDCRPTQAKPDSKLQTKTRLTRS